jgi:putative ABC transport system permease protein
MENAINDFRFGLRMLLKGRSTTVVALLALMIGIGASTAMFSVINSMMLRPLPYKDADRLAMIWQTNPEIKLSFDKFPASIGKFLDWRAQATSFESMSAFTAIPFNLEQRGEPEKLGGAVVSADFFSVFGVKPLIGRSFGAEEGQPGHNLVVVIGYGLWQRRFNRDPGIIGQSIRLDGQDYTVIGVMPAGFSFPRGGEMPAFFQLPARSEIWSPIAATAEQIAARDNNVNKGVIGRLKSDVTLQQAQVEINTISGRLAEQYPDSDGGFGAELIPLRDQIIGSLKLALFVLMGAVGFVLLIACANVANLLLARGASREKELAIRSALGASRLRVVRQLLTESVVLSLAGGVLGLAVAVVGVRVLIAITPDNIPGIKEVSVDLRVLGFTLLMSLLTGIIFGTAPAFHGSRTDINEPLKEGGRGSTSGRHLTKDLLVISEVALALVLLVGAGLMIRSFLNIEKVDPGLTPGGVLTAQISLPKTRYPDDIQRARFQKDLIDRLKSLPGVESASVSLIIPLTGAEEVDGFEIEGRPKARSVQEATFANFTIVSADYFKTMGIPVLAGRPFTEADTQTAPSVVVVNQAFARKFFPNEDALGKRLAGGPNSWITLVGVVGDVRRTALDADPQPEWYRPFGQSTNDYFGVLLKAAPGLDPRGLAPSLTSSVWSIDPDLPVYSVQTMDQILSVSLSRRRFNMILLGIFAVSALMLAAVGIYGIMSYGVTQRTHEIGIRMALGARAGDVLGMVVGQGMRLAIIGLAIGLAGSFALTKVMATLLFGITATDPLTFAAVPAVLGAVALLACYVPARRATRVDSMVALRHE